MSCYAAAARERAEMYPSTRNLLSLNCDTLDDVLFPYFAQTVGLSSTVHSFAYSCIEIVARHSRVPSPPPPATADAAISRC